jgi:exonuclease SbcC
MRLHHVEITAFGPFAETVRVDFDELSEAGLFLLSGATGAGKTSILDAVCFALYGDVPGDRGAAKRLRCDQAPPGARPLVTLEVTLGSRRFRLVRSPAWERPKKRGVGMTTEQAGVTISELSGGRWQPLSSRLDETGDLVGRLVGMTLTQFTQVAMLPQGRFQVFLRARSEDRHRLLQQLFRTGRFEQVERWLRDRRLELRNQCRDAHQGVADLVSRLSETTAEPFPDDWDVNDLDRPAADGSLAAWVTGRRTAAAAEREAADGTVADITALEQRTRAELEAARARLQRRARVTAAAEEQAGLLDDAEAHAERERALDGARRAAAIGPLLRLAATAGTALASAERAAATATAHVVARTGRELSGTDELTVFVSEELDAAARVRALQPRAARLEQVAAEIQRRTADQRSLALEVGQVTRRREQAPAELVRVRADLQLAEAATAALDSTRLRIAAVHERLAAHAEIQVLETQIEAARVARRDAKEVALACREKWLSVKEARLDSMAAEIAGQLAVGACCPVCGSADHPAKATHSPGAADAALEKESLKALDDAKATEHLRELEVRDLETRLTVHRRSAGDQPAPELRARLAELTAEAERLDQLARQSEQLAGRVLAAQARVDADAELARTLAARSAATVEALASLTADRASLEAELSEALGSGADLDQVLDAHVAAAAAGRAALQALAALDTAKTAYADAERELAAAAADNGFAGPAEAAAAAISAVGLGRLEARVAHHQQRLAAVTEVLDEPGARDLVAAAPPDVAGLAATHETTMRRLADAQAAAASWLWRERRLAELDTRLEAAVAAWRPVRDELELTTQLSSFVEGKAPDNRLQMRLSAYVLAYRLSQVVAAANLRLARMSDQRYSLQHTPHRGAGETRGGLSLQVRDDWSGESRDPATLSGGETFVVSLALALGLADVITQESDSAAEGSRLETLFVDEGFGSLDAETLDDVMDTLDSLRDGGRVVGVVSHVAEMRDRIPTQLLVSKSRQGSTVAVRR